MPDADLAEVVDEFEYARGVRPPTTHETDQEQHHRDHRCVTALAWRLLSATTVITDSSNRLRPG